MKKCLLREACLILAVLLGLSMQSTAQTKAKVLIFNSIGYTESRVWSVSDNGIYAVGSSAGEDASLYPFVWNLQDNTQYFLKDKEDPTQNCLIGDAQDITDDGKIIAGSYNSRPALYNTETDTWTMLPLPAEYPNGIGMCAKITPDGKSGIGLVFDGETYFGTACYWRDGELVDLNLPKTNMFGGNVNISRYDDISADGNLIVGRLSYNEIPASSSGFIYKVDTKEFKYIAEDIMKTVDPAGNLLDNHLEEMVISADGKTIAGVLYEETYIGGEGENYDMFATQAHNTGFTYDVAQDKLTSYKGAQEAFFAIDQNGTLYGVDNLLSPFRDAFVIKDGKFSRLAEYVQNEYGIEDLQSTVGYDFSGTVAGVSTDGSVMVYNSSLSGGLAYAIVPENQATGIGQVLPTSDDIDAYLQGRTIYLKGEIRSIAVYSPLGVKLLEKTAPAQQVELTPYEGVVFVQLTGKQGQKTVRKLILK